MLHIIFFLILLINCQELYSTQEKDVKSSKSELSEQEIIKSLNIEEGGNWLKKRKIWERSNSKFDKIKKMIQEINKLKMTFIKKRNESNKKYEKFHNEIGLEQEDLEKVIRFLKNEVEKEREKQGALTEEEREFVEELKEKRNELKQLELDVKAVAELDSSLDNVEDVLKEQISNCNNYEKKAKEHLQSIAEELSDTEAKTYSIYIENYLENIAIIQNYLKNQLLAYFTDSIHELEQQMKKVTYKIKEMEEEGTNLKEKFKKLESDDITPPPITVEKKEVKKDSGLSVKMGFWGNLKFYWTNAVNFFQNLFKKYYKKIFTR